MNIIARRRDRDGWMVTFEIADAFTKPTNTHPETGAPTTSRFEQRWVRADRLAAASTDDERMQVLSDALEQDPLAGLVGVDVRAWRELKTVSATPLADLREIARRVGGKG